MDNHDLLILILLIVAIYGVWHYGHRGIWSKVANRFKLNNPERFIEITKNGFDIGFVQNNKWEGGFYASGVHANEQGLLFKSPRYIRIMLPNIYLPISSVASIQNDPEARLGQPCSELKINNFDISILIPSKIASLISTRINNAK